MKVCCDTEGRELTDERRYAPTSVPLRRKPCSRSPETLFHFTGIPTHLNYFLKNRHRFAYTTMVGLGLPRGSGAVESAIRRVINLRIKGASIYWLPESVDAILLLRSFYKSGRWNCLQRMAMTPVGVSA